MLKDKYKLTDLEEFNDRIRGMYYGRKKRDSQRKIIQLYM